MTLRRAVPVTAVTATLISATLVDPATVSEPSSLVLLGAGVLLLALVLRRVVYHHAPTRK